VNITFSRLQGAQCNLVTYDTPARKLLGALNSSLSKRIAADGEVMSNESYVTLHLHESQIAINKRASRLVA
jgi:hypothetical protein